MLSILANSSIGLNLVILLFYLKKINVFLNHFTLKFYFLNTEFLEEHDAFEQNSSRKMSLIKASVQSLSRVQLFATP